MPYSVALVQNQSEMSHYGYADARPLFDEFPQYSVELYTADNIEGLAFDLTRGAFDAVVVASNALNDTIIRDAIFTDTFRLAVNAHLQKGKGLLILHQLKLASLPENALSFLPDPYRTIAPAIRPPAETATEGALIAPEVTTSSPLLIYPAQVSIEEIKNLCLSFNSLKGLYWHYWNNVQSSLWDTFLLDPADGDTPRPLLVATKPTETFRVVLCSLAVDWQSQRPLLRNLLSYVVEGSHATAVVRSNRMAFRDFDYLIGALTSRKFPFREYVVGSDLLSLERNLSSNAHSILIIDPLVEDRDLPLAVRNAIAKGIASGSLKVIRFQSRQDDWIGPHHFAVWGHERLAIRLLAEIELEVHREILEHYYVDGSFWSTADTLEALESVAERKSQFADDAALVFTLADTHDRQGSYDETPGATIALFWLRATYLGLKADKTRATANWLSDRIAEFGDREKVLAYLNMVNVGYRIEESRLSLTALLTNAQVRQMRELDLMTYLQAATAVRHIEMIASIVDRLCSLQGSDGTWVDLATTAALLDALLDAALVLRDTSEEHARRQEDVGKALLRAMIRIQSAFDDSALSSSEHPWIGKTSTAARCIKAWLRFDREVQLPMTEVIGSLEQYSRSHAAYRVTHDALNVLDAYKDENEQLRERTQQLRNEMEAVTPTLQRASFYRRATFVGAILLAAIAYTGTSVFMWDARRNEERLVQGIGVTLNGAFLDSWAVHLTIITAIAGTVGAYVAFVAWLRPRIYSNQLSGNQEQAEEVTNEDGLPAEGKAQ